MAESIDTRKTITLLNDLIHLDYDAVAAYQAAITRLTDRADQAQLLRFMDDHLRHIGDLAFIVRENGGAPVTEADFKMVLTKGKVVIAGLRGDKAILEAMKSNEDATNAAYERALREPLGSMHVRQALERNLNDERRHRAWIEQRLGSLEAGPISASTPHR
jgi:uncharacterized protein (TIGR02284 family)